MSSAAALKAWDTRRANSGVTTPSKPGIPEPRNPDIDLIMTIGVGESDGLPEITCSFVFMNKNKVAELSSISMEDRALLSIRLVSGGTTADSNAQFLGHDRTRVYISGGTADHLDAILPKMRTLDSVLAKAFADSEDSSLPMAIQAISWNLRCDWIAFEGKRQKRGTAYPMGESVIESILSLYTK
jgi:hypothetical protein